jgi:hypothetical protein
MRTDTLFQIIDRQAIALLKAFHYEKDSTLPAASMAREQAAQLAIAGDLYLYECLSGELNPAIQRHLRYHDHGKAEGKWAGKSGLSSIEGDSLMEVAGELALTHARYWELQTMVQHLKGWIDQQENNPQEKARLESKFVNTQRKIDLLNQKRSELVSAGDELFVAMVEGKRKGR